TLLRGCQRRETARLLSLVNLTEVLVAPAADRNRLQTAREAIAALGVQVHQPGEAVGVEAARLRSTHQIRPPGCVLPRDRPLRRRHDRLVRREGRPGRRAGSNRADRDGRTETTTARALSPDTVDPAPVRQRPPAPRVFDSAPARLARGDDTAAAAFAARPLRARSRSQKTKPSRSTTSPRRQATGALKIGPAWTNVWNSPFSPQGSTELGRSASRARSKARPANDPSSLRGSTQIRFASKPASMKSRASFAVSRPQIGKRPRRPTAASCCSR